MLGKLYQVTSDFSFSGPTRANTSYGDFLNKYFKKGQADFTVREMYFSDISKDTAFLLQGFYETDPMAKLKDVTT